MKQNIKYIATAVEWFDSANGNSYHSVKVLRLKDNKLIKSNPVCYGYDDAYRQTALELMFENKWLPSKYTKKDSHMFERENKYPIYWSMTRNSRKRDMIQNVA